MPYDFRVDILRNRAKIGELNTTSVKLNFDESKEVMKSMSVDMHGFRMSQSTLTFDMFKDRLRPVLIIDGKESPLGIYMVVAAPKTITDTETYHTIEAYDETMILKQSYFESRTYYPAGTRFLRVVQDMLTAVGFTDLYVEDSTSSASMDFEIAPGENFLETINDILDAINFQHIYADENGTINIRKVRDQVAPQFVYRSSDDFTLFPKIREDTDIYDLPNVIVGIYSSPDTDTPIVYKRVNDDPNSIISTVSRGYKVVKTVDIRNNTTEADLEGYIDRLAFEAMQATESVEFTTAAEGGHEPNVSVQIDTDSVRGLFVEKGWEMSISTGSFEMTHRAERKVFV